MASASGPKGIDYAAIASNDYKLYYISKDWYRSRDEPPYFYSLDFGTAWPVSAPAWTKLVYNNASLRSIFGRTKIIGLSKDGSLLYVPGCMEPVRVYDTAEAEWEQEVKQDEYKDRPTINSIMVLDPDNEVIYGTDDETDHTKEFAPPDLSLSLYKYEIRTWETSRERIRFPWMDFSDIQMVVHSSARESLLFLTGSEAARMREYHIPTTTMRVVVWNMIFIADRCHDGEAYNGTKLVLSGGQRIYNWTSVVEQEDQVVFTASR
ncbi:hypothetical protein BG003_008433 [Podila horticola]|nr:hypothetical protein BG003_008433 [Podila horticola]